MKKTILSILCAMALTVSFAGAGFAGDCCEGKVKSADGGKAMVTCKDGKEMTVDCKDVKAGDEITCKDGKAMKKGAKKKVEGC
jgi:hypothetical protein